MYAEQWNLYSCEYPHEEQTRCLYSSYKTATDVKAIKQLTMVIMIMQFIKQILLQN